MATLLDQIPEEGDIPSAVISRPGESREQTSMRHAGFGDEETGYGYRSGGSPLLRAAALANQRERAAATQGRFDARMSFDQQQQALRQQQFEMQARVHQSAMDDRQAAIEQTHGLLDSIEKIAQDPASPRGSRAFYARALAAAPDFPAAIHGDARLGAMIEHYGKQHEALGGHPDLPMALWEVGQFDPNAMSPNDAQQYLGTLRAKYPAVAADKAFAAALTEKQKEMAAILAPKAAEDISAARARGANSEKPQGLTAEQQELKAHRKISELQSRDTALAKDIGTIEKSKPKWLDSTGLDPSSGQFRYAEEDSAKPGFKGVAYKPSEREVAQYQSYKAALAERQKIAGEMAKHRAGIETGFKDEAATAKALDADTAKSILAETGGDKEKARQLAKDRGFHF